MEIVFFWRVSIAAATFGVVFVLVVAQNDAQFTVEPHQNHLERSRVKVSVRSQGLDLLHCFIFEVRHASSTCRIFSFF
jgi:hypothetical protein